MNKGLGLVLVILVGVAVLCGGCAEPLGECEAVISWHDHEAMMNEQGGRLTDEIRGCAGHCNLLEKELEEKTMLCEGLKQDLDNANAEIKRLSTSRQGWYITPSDYYSIKIYCDNCHREITLRVPKGITVRDFASKVICPYCGCPLED